MWRSRTIIIQMWLPLIVVARAANWLIDRRRERMYKLEQAAAAAKIQETKSAQVATEQTAAKLATVQKDAAISPTIINPYTQAEQKTLQNLADFMPEKASKNTLENGRERTILLFGLCRGIQAGVPHTPLQQLGIALKKHPYVSAAQILEMMRTPCESVQMLRRGRQAVEKKLKLELELDRNKTRGLGR